MKFTFRCDFIFFRTFSIITRASVRIFISTVKCQPNDGVNSKGPFWVRQRDQLKSMCNGAKLSASTGLKLRLIQLYLGEDLVLRKIGIHTLLPRRSRHLEAPGALPPHQHPAFSCV